MKILNDGIYFKQTNMKEIGFYTEDETGNLVHHEYKKPKFWEKAKFYAINGYEMNTETISTSYFYFLPDFNLLYYEDKDGDAVTVAKSLRKNRIFGHSIEYNICGETVNFESESIFYHLIFSNDGMYFTLNASREKDNKVFKPEIYTFLNWYNI